MSIKTINLTECIGSIELVIDSEGLTKISNKLIQQCSSCNAEAQCNFDCKLLQTSPAACDKRAKRNFIIFSLQRLLMDLPRFDFNIEDLGFQKALEHLICAIECQFPHNPIESSENHG